MSQQPDQNPTADRSAAHPTPAAGVAEAMTMNDYASLTWDRQSDPDSDARFHALREAGHTGLIDSHGYAVTEHPAPHAYPTSARTDLDQALTHREDLLQQIRQNILDQADRESTTYLGEYTAEPDTDEDTL